MIVEKKVVDYINSLNKDDYELLYKIEQDAKNNSVPIIRTETKELLKVMLLMKKPLRVLEVGTAVGYSAIFMSQFLPEEGIITTIERYQPRIDKAKENIRLTKSESKITLLEGDAIEILKNLNDPFDMVFMDAAKGQYINFFPDIMRLLKQGGVLISDNVLQDGEVANSRFAVTRRNRTIHNRMREYLYTIKNMKELETVILPIGDGVTLSTKL